MNGEQEQQSQNRTAGKNLFAGLLAPLAVGGAKVPAKEKADEKQTRQNKENQRAVHGIPPQGVGWSNSIII